MPVKHIAIEGNIASGKSTVIKNMVQMFQQKKILCKTYAEPILEWLQFGSQNTNMLREMYQKPSANSFMFQLIALLTKCEQLKAISQESVVIVERSIKAQERVFIPLLRENRNLTILENEVLIRFKDLLLTWEHLTPNVILYLRCSPEVSKTRIASRGREEEEKISLEYLRKLNSRYEAWMKNEENVVEINADDFVNLDCNVIYEKIKQYL